MKLKLTATIKKEALLPPAIQDVDLQKELNKPGIVQQVNESDQVTNLDQALKQLWKKYPAYGNWDGEALIADLVSIGEKSKIAFGVGFGPDKNAAGNEARVDLAYKILDNDEQLYKQYKNDKKRINVLKDESQGGTRNLSFSIMGTMIRGSYPHKNGTNYALVTFWD